MAGMNKFMHPRNPYRKRPDFKQLAIEFPEFRKYAKQDLSGKIQFNFKDQGAVWALTKCLLKRDFDLDVEILPERLVPTLPLRLNYLLWIEDLLSIYKPKKVHGIDIGTGTTCIYPLIAAKQLGWNMLGTDIDIPGVKCALSNVENNFLSDKIQIKAVTEDIILNGVLDEETIYDFCMCNPPFFSDSEELIMEKHSRKDSRQGPSNAPSGIAQELVTPGGELVFVARIINDSQALKDKIRIYTTMVGKKSNLRHLKELVRECEEVSSIATSVFCQGKTTRWGLAWTYVPGLDLNVAPHVSRKKKALSFAPFTHVIPLTEDVSFESVKNKLFSTFELFQIETDFEDNEGAIMITLKAYENTWINARKRRRQQRLLEQKEAAEGLEVGEGPCLVEKMETTPASPEAVTSSDSKPERDQSSEQPDSSKVSETGEGARDLNEPNGSGQNEKKRKHDEIEKTEYLVASLIMKEDYDSNELLIEMYFIEGTGGKDAANQLLTILKNRLKS